MIPGSFSYHSPSTLEEAVGLAGLPTWTPEGDSMARTVWVELCADARSGTDGTGNLDNDRWHH